jgi:signal transduction histidine kinase
MAFQLEEAARQQQALDTLRRDLIAWAGHDLRTPLASVQAIVEALADGMVEDADTVDRYLRTAQREIRSLSLLIDDLFELSQLEAGGLELEAMPNSLSDLISDTIEAFSELAARQQVGLEGSVVQGLDPVLFDVQQIGRVLANLVGNGLRHTPAGGQVRIRAFPVEEGVRVAISDNGEGIDDQDLPFVFERFYRGEKSRSRATGGAGLGLAIAKGIIEAHGGEIGVESTRGEGTCFFFVLPQESSLRHTDSHGPMMVKV